jgi:hypothetical protein
MTEADFREHWEQAAEAEFTRLRQIAPQKLLLDIAQRKFGSYYQIWNALQGRTSLEEASTLLLEILRSSTDYLNRYHCANLLLSLYNPSPKTLNAVKLSGREVCDVDRNLQEYEQALAARV